MTDSFNIKTNIQPDLDPGLERRLHLLAYDYWIELKAELDMPDFRQLTPDGMQPFKKASLLIDFSIDTKNINQQSHLSDDISPETEIRFVGDTVSGMVSDTGFTADHSCHPIIETYFGTNLINHLKSPSTREIPCEFDYRDGTMTGRGVMMPLALRGQKAAMIWVVVSFDQGGYLAKGENNTENSANMFNDQLKVARSMAENSPGLGGGARAALYKALASAYKLYEMSLSHPPSWLMLLKKSGIRSQKRAPFTPALKLVFGSEYDKTRLTEYAAALSHAARNNITSDQFPRWIDHFAGGIKGCVEQERLTKQNSAARNKNLVENARHTKAIGSLDLIIEPEYTLALIRRKPDGKGDVIGLQQIEDHQLMKILNRYSTQFEERANKVHGEKNIHNHCDRAGADTLNNPEFGVAKIPRAEFTGPKNTETPPDSKN